MKKKNKIVVIIGPTASGKSELGVRIAKKFNAEIISADSRQVYKGLDVGSGKVRGKWVPHKRSKDLNRGEYYHKGIRHHCLDIADPKKIFTAADFVACGRRAIVDILTRGKTPIIVGGTGFYIDALLGRVRLAPVPPNPVLRKKLRNYSTTQLFNYLIKLDPQRAETIDSKNPRRLIRAIEIAQAQLTQHQTLERVLRPKRAWFFRKAKKSEGRNLETRALGATKKVKEIDAASIKTVWLGIQRSPENLKKRIHTRLIKRLPGIIREVRALHAKGLSWKRLYDFGLEYRYVSLYLRGKLKAPLSSKLQTAIGHYAKRQMTWWRKNKEIRWIQTYRETQCIIPKN
ncbi:MAG TPA: tRNA (adenosine(37)-N6)-dimethylallyltransferase MiaA [Candidatus Paceibacterota bacterium]